jgi:hypothetical protein
MPKHVPDEQKKINCSCTLAPDMIASIEKYRADPVNQRKQANGFPRAPTFTEVIEDGLRKLPGFEKAERVERVEAKGNED